MVTLGPLAARLAAASAASLPRTPTWLGIQLSLTRLPCATSSRQSAEFHSSWSEQNGTSLKIASSMYRNAYAGAKKYKAGISPPVRRVSRQATGGSRGGVVTVSHLRHWSPCRARRGVGT
ncbi:hypothetical protein GWK47_013108 [Chionoecetes opilio]|uniref:Uncharacterized protein n=1 Tax=Chionoecetes opilio TaxID=41210 RepID=A0A8J4XWU5_CHIOP|nr:hypothetical protein GWK47_013108 [Chionoecetes opilio]